MVNQRARGFGIGFYFLPIRITLEFGPIFLGGVAAFVGEYVDESIFGFRFVLGNPVTDVSHAVFFKQFGCVIVKAIDQGIELAVSGSVGADFEDSVLGFATGGLRICRAVLQGIRKPDRGDLSGRRCAAGAGAGRRHGAGAASQCGAAVH